MKKTYILATDLDDTLVGSQLALKNLYQYISKQDVNIKLIYLTGRHLHSAKQLIIDEEIPIPDVLICDVGCSIYIQSNAPFYEFSEDIEWQENIYANWSKEEILKEVKKLNLPLQTDVLIKKRISLNVFEEKKVKQLQQNLIQQNIPVKLIYSSNKDLDILPSNSGKGNALIYTMKKYFKENQSVLVAGNSENDLEMLCLGYPSVIVGNAEEVLLSMHNVPFIYKAEGHYADGIKEGFKYFYG